MAGRGFADINASLRYARVCHAADDSPGMLASTVEPIESAYGWGGAALS